MKVEDLVDDYQMIPLEHQKNLQDLAERVTFLEEAYGHLFKVNSGYRTWAQHKRIYQEINDRRMVQGKHDLPIPLHSNHLIGNAVDVADPTGGLKVWLGKNLSTIEQPQINLYFEAFSWTNGFVHMQRVAPKSGNRWFIPY